VNIRLLACVLACLLAVPAGPCPAGEFHTDAVYRQIEANRAAYGRVVFFLGDSVSMMCSLEEVDFSALSAHANDPQWLVSAMAAHMRAANDPGEMIHDPLWPMHSMAAAMNFLFARSGLLTTPDGGATIPSARLVATYAGDLGQPVPADVADRVRLITRRIDAGIIRDGDVVVFEDAGYHGENPDQYEDNWKALAWAVLGRVDVTLVMMDMFDEIPDHPILGLPPQSHQYLAMYKSPRIHGARSHNQATRDAAAAVWHSPGRKGQLVFLDLRLAMDGLKRELAREFRVSPLSPEGIHPNVWGEALMVREILRGTGLASLVTDREAYLNLLADNASRLALPAKDIDKAKARALIAARLLP
jgi:hypothetical protein